MQPAPGRSEPLGLTFQEGKGNFALYAASASKVSLCLFLDSLDQPSAEFPMERTKDTWHVEVGDLPEKGGYAYRIDDNGSYLCDPYAKALLNRGGWHDPSSKRVPMIGSIAREPEFDWQGVKKPEVKWEDLIIYEMHVRGFTAHESSGAAAKGTFAGLIEKIPYLKELGVTAVELLPIYEFDENNQHSTDPQTHQPLPNYWGYQPLSFFTPMTRYASQSDDWGPVIEFKTMVRELHRAGIEVILDVVYNHTGEQKDYAVSFRGIDRSSYYIVDEQGHDRDYTGCGNTFQSNNFAGERTILDSLTYWSEEMGVDGFRFDLASVLTRAPDGRPMGDPPILKAIDKNPRFKKVKWIAEPWDCAGLYQVGQFPHWGRWSEWNGRYRDHVRRFIKGTDGEAGGFAGKLCGSEGIYGRFGSPHSSINFVTAHDGFCLRDLVSYDHKHNMANGEHNRDGANTNDSWNCGVEGPTNDRGIIDLRERQLRNFWLALMLSQGIPMMLMGDEIGHTRKGNNNPYTQDNDLNWHIWDNIEKNRDMFEFVASLIRFRKQHPLLATNRFRKQNEIDWHGTTPFHPDWTSKSRFVAFALKEKRGPVLYAAFNSNFHAQSVTLPGVDNQWLLVVDTSLSWNRHFLNEPQNAPTAAHQITLAPHSAILAVARQ